MAALDLCVPNELHGILLSDQFPILQAVLKFVVSFLGVGQSFMEEDFLGMCDLLLDCRFF